MKHNIFPYLRLMALLCAMYIPNYSHCQGIWDAWDKSASSVDHDALVRAVENAINKTQGQKSTSRERAEERREAERQNQLRNKLRNCSSLLSYINDADYRWMILHESEFRDQFRYQLLNSKDIVDYFMDDDELRKIILSDNSLFQRLKTRMLENPDKILDYMEDSDLKEVISSDPELNRLYELKYAEYDVMSHPENLSKYIKDPEMKNHFLNDPEMKKIVTQKYLNDIKKEQETEKQRAIAAKQAEERRIQEEKAAAEREKQEAIDKENARLAEIQRQNDNAVRAKIQYEQNEQQKQKDIAHSEKLKSMIVPRQDKGLKNNGVDDEIDAFNVLYEDMAVNRARKTSAVYSTQDGLNKALEDAGIRAKIELKKKQKEWQGKVVSIPIGKANELMNKTLETAYPGAGMWKKVKVSQAVRQDEEGLVSTVFKCIAKEGVEAVASGDMKQFNECINEAKDTFLDKTGAHIADLTHTKNFRKIYKWFTKTEQNDEEY